MHAGLKISRALITFLSLHIFSGCGGSGGATTAAAGADQIAGSYQLITLDATGSKAADGGALTYQWKQLNSHWNLVTGNLNSAVVSLYIPSAGVPAQGAEFELTVTDKAGKTHSDKVKILPAACTRVAGELFTDCLDANKQAIQQDAIQGVLAEGYGNTDPFLQWALIDAQDSSRGKIIDLQYTTRSDRQAYFAIQSAGENLEQLTEGGAVFVEFDIRLVDSPTTTPQFYLQVESLTHKNSAWQLTLANTKAWQHIKVPLAYLASDWASLYAVTRMFAISPAAQSQQSIHFQLDNIKWVAEDVGTIADDYANPLVLGFPASNGATAKVSANVLGVGITPFPGGIVPPVDWEVQGNSIKVTNRSEQGIYEIIIDLRDTWAPHIGGYLNDYSLRFDISGINQLSQASVFFTQANGSERSVTAQRHIPFIINSGEAIALPHIEIPLRAFDNLGALPVESLRIRYRGNDRQGDVTLSNFSLVKSTPTARVTPINTYEKIGAPAQAGQSYTWSQLNGPEVVLINDTKGASAQLEFRVPSAQIATPLIFRRKTLGTDGVESEEFLSLYRTGKCILPAGAIFEDCVEDRFGPAAGSGKVTVGSTSYYFPLPETSFARGLYPVVAQELISPDPGHNQVIDVLFKNADNYSGKFIIPYSDKIPVNLHEYTGGSLEFDLKVIDYGEASAGLKVSSVVNYDLLPITPTNQWQHFSLPIRPASLFWPLITEQEALFGITSANEHCSGIHFQLDNIRLVKGPN